MNERHSRQFNVRRGSRAVSGRAGFGRAALVVPEPAAAATTARPTGASDRADAKKKDDLGGW